MKTDTALNIHIYRCVWPSMWTSRPRLVMKHDELFSSYFCCISSRQ